MAKSWISNDSGAGSEPDTDISSWTSNQKTCFLDSLMEKTVEKPLQAATLTKMDKRYNMSTSQNCEILFRYVRLAIAAEETSVLPIACRFITAQGRMKYIRPIYRALYASTMGKRVAVDTFQANIAFYHGIAQTMISRDLNLNSDESQLKKTKMKAMVEQILVGVAVVGIVAVIVRRAKK